MSMLLRRLLLKGGGITKRIARAAVWFVSFKTNLAAPVKITSEFVPMQSGAGDPSPSNVRPISGYTEINVTRAGKIISEIPYTFSNSTYSKTLSGEEKESVIKAFQTLPAGRYVLGGQVTNVGTTAIIGIRFTYVSGNAMSIPLVTQNTGYDDGWKTNAFTLPEEHHQKVVSAVFIYFGQNRPDTENPSVISNLKITNADDVPLSADSYAGTTYEYDFPPLGVNLFNVSAKKRTSLAQMNFNGISYCSVNAAGAVVDNTLAFVPAAECLGIPVAVNDVVKIYFFGSLPTTARASYCICNSSGVVTSRGTYAKTGTPPIGTLTVEESGYLILEWALDDVANSGIVITKNESAALTEYVPYTPMYGGTLTINEDGSGTLVMQKWKSFVGSDLTWTKVDTAFATVNSNRISDIYAVRDALSIVSDHYKGVSMSQRTTNGNNTDYEVSIHSSGKFAVVKDTRLSSMTDEEIAAELSNVNFLYRSTDESITYALSPAQVQTLLGTNNIWHDLNGDIEVEYYYNS